MTTDDAEKKPSEENEVDEETREREMEAARKRKWAQTLTSSEAALNRKFTEKKSDEDKALIRLALHRSPFFTCMDEEQIERFVQVATLRKYDPGEMVILEGKIDDDQEPTIEVKEEVTEEHPVNETIEEATGEYVNIDLEEQNPLEEAASALRSEEESTTDATTTATVNLEEAGPAEVEEIDETFADEPEPVHKKALKIVAAVADAERVPLDIEQVSQSAKDKRESLSGMPSCVYTVRSGHADVWHENFNTSSLGPGHIFGEGGFLFHRMHSASVVAAPSSELECWVVPIHLFLTYVLPSPQMVNMFVKYASRETDAGVPYMTMDDFVHCVGDIENTADDPTAASRVANTYNILRKTEGLQKIDLSDFCLFYLLMARPDPEVDIAFLFMDQSRTGTITLDDFKNFLELQEGGSHFDLDSDFVHRHFGKDGKRSIRPNVFPQFLADFQREMGRQAFLHDVDMNGTPEGYLSPVDFVKC